MIIVAPVAGVDEWERFATALGTVVHARPDRYLGGSRTAPLTATANSYLAASHALVVARRTAGRMSLADTEDRLADLLSPWAQRWAHELLKPVLLLKSKDSKAIREVVQLYLQFGGEGAARLSGMHRNTIRNICKRAQGLLGCDLNDTLVRARLDLALQLDPGAVNSGDDAPARLSALLTDQPALLWAQRRLAPLETGGRNLRRTLLTWIRCGTSVDLAAQKLGLSPGTVRVHLKAAGGLLQRDLMSPAGPYDLVLALMAEGALPPEPAPSP
ncbi:hypothetical protein GXW82_21875 [Streptacidiphilus sp. 4-A2]|nr:hypothetical protein [Streptacidiphilus sp. 4-A2]